MHLKAARQGWPPPAPPSIPVVATPSGSERRVAVPRATIERPPHLRPCLPRDGEVLAGSASIGAPRSNLDARDARAAYVSGRTFVGRHEWSSAERWLREAIRLDGSRAEYHAALGDVLATQDHGLEAEAAFTAAVARRGQRHNGSVSRKRGRTSDELCGHIAEATFRCE